jgi:hypothetical protein
MYLLNIAAIFWLRVKYNRQIPGILFIVDISVPFVCIRKTFFGCRIRYEYAHFVVLFDYSGNSVRHKSCVSPFFTNICSKYFLLNKVLKIYDSQNERKRIKL